jgi:hypothetical protein
LLPQGTSRPFPSDCATVNCSHSLPAIGKYKPQDATTNPSLILAATKKAEYAALLDAAVAQAKSEGGSIDAQVDSALDHLLVEFGTKILEIIPGKVSTEVDAALSFDTQASVAKALQIIAVSSCLPYTPPRPAEPSLTASTALQGGWHLEGPRSHQGCLDMGGYQGCRDPPARPRHQLQPDPDVLPRPGHCRR